MSPPQLVPPAATTSEIRSDLAPYLPRLVIEWQTLEPEATFKSIEGTLLLVDISGFTRLSEKLAARGKVGSEEITDAINSAFSELLEIAWGVGGNLIKFGGDALLLFFSDDDHVIKACHAAANMRAALRRCGRIETGSHVVRLRMSAGIETGAFRFYLVGKQHRELIITGPTTTKTVEAESLADTGEILLGPMAARSLDNGLLVLRADGRFLLRRAPKLDANAAHPPSSYPDTDLSILVPSALREHIGNETRNGEHRPATVGFIHFQGTDQILEAEGLAGVHQRLQALVSCAQAAAQEFDLTFLGTDVAGDGGKIILVSGAPVSKGNDEERMLRALRQIADSCDCLDLRIGCAHGRVFAGEIGPLFRRTYTIMGNTVNLAARLMAHADKGQILALPTVLAGSRTRFTSDRVPPLSLKGIKKPVEACSVGEIVKGSQAQNRESGELPLIGRDSELSTLITSIEKAEAGHGNLVELIGEAGLGKSRLLRELSARKPKSIFRRMSCEQYEMATPFFPFRTLFANLVGIAPHTDTKSSAEILLHSVAKIAPKLGPWTPLIATVLDVPLPNTDECNALGPKFRMAKLHWVVAEFMSKALPEPTTFIVEDAHWMDDASRDLLTYLLDHTAEFPWLICITRRNEGKGYAAESSVPTEEIRLRPLTKEASAAIASTTSDVALPKHTIQVLAERAGGNPLFMRELVAACQEPGGDLEALPDSIESLISARIDTLAPSDREILRHASVIGSRFSPRLLETEFADELGVIENITWANLTEFVDTSTGDSYQFRHALFRDAAYESLSYKRRKELHGRIALMFEDTKGTNPDDIAETLSLHFYRAQKYDSAWRYSKTAGNRAKDKSANVEAAEFYRRALDAGKSVAEIDRNSIAEVSEALGDVLQLAGQFDPAATAYNHARVASRWESSDEGRLFWKEGLMREHLGKYVQAFRWWSRGLSLLEQSGDTSKSTLDMRTTIRLAYAGVRFRQGKLQDCIQRCKEIVEEAKQTENISEMAHAYYILDSAIQLTGKLEEATYGELALPIYEELGDLVGQANVLINIGAKAYYLGEWDKALSLYDRGKKASDGAGDIVSSATAANNIAEILSDQGRLSEADDLFLEALQVFEAAHYPIGVTLIKSNLGRVASRAGDHNKAEELLEQALKGFDDLGVESLFLETKARIAENHLLTGEYQKIHDIATESIVVLEREDSAPTFMTMLHRVRGYAYAQEGKMSDAITELNTSLELGRSQNADFEVALTLQALARLSTNSHKGRVKKWRDESKEILERLGVVHSQLLPI